MWYYFTTNNMEEKTNYVENMKMLSQLYYWPTYTREESGRREKFVELYASLDPMLINNESLNLNNNKD